MRHRMQSLSTRRSTMLQKKREKVSRCTSYINTISCLFTYLLNVSHINITDQNHNAKSRALYVGYNCLRLLLQGTVVFQTPSGSIFFFLNLVIRMISIKH